MILDEKENEISRIKIEDNIIRKSIDKIIEGNTTKNNIIDIIYK